MRTPHPSPLPEGEGALSRAPLLRVRDVDVAYGEVQVLWGVSLDVFAGEIVALVGANGAGKSTLLSTISGLLSPRSGAIEFAGHPIAGAPTQRMVELGIAHVPEGRRLFPAMSVRDQLLLGAFRRNDRQAVERDLQRVVEIFPRVKERLHNLAGHLSGGEQQMVAIARGVMARPKLLMIDELSLGLAPVVIEALMETIGRLNAEGMTILIVEQDVQAALERATRGYVLETGHIVLQGSAETLLRDERVRQAYLGV
ncbi:MAG: ABC transporter ATP-binding protein [Chloroflexi bacterium]|nr:MAG: ABC transporter ATP-binding protein [Chloroflexota bacterium]